MASGGMPYGMAAMLKEGHQMFSGLDEAVLKNINACKELSLLTKSSMGPNGGWLSVAVAARMPHAGSYMDVHHVHPSGGPCRC